MRLRVLVTGGTGFIGSHVAERLQRMGHDVTILHRPDSPTLLPACSVRRVSGDVTDPASLCAACASQDSVVHTAGLVGSWDRWRAYHRVNVLGTYNVVRAALAAGVSRFVHLSSLIVHAAPRRTEPIRETTPLRLRVPIWNHYARSKLMAERVVLDAHLRDRIASILIRPGVVLGPRDRWTTPWILRALARRRVTLVGSSSNRIPCVVVEELADAIARAATLPDLVSEVFDLAGCTAITQRELFEFHGRAIGRPVASFAVPAPLAWGTAWLLDALDASSASSPLPPRRLAVEIASADGHVDFARAAAVLGWRGIASCEDAIRRAVQWERSEHGASHPWPGASPRARQTEPTAVGQ
jgi:nucleoside-diphosphate-sugar epimerase